MGGQGGDRREAMTRPWLLWLIPVILIALGYFGGGYRLQAQRAEIDVNADLYGEVVLDMRLLQLDKRALDDAYHEQLLRLWKVWLTEGAKDPQFFQKGLSNARRAYNHAAKQIADRENVLFERERLRNLEQQR